MSNTFITVSPVDTLNRGRIYQNQSAETLLTNFYSPNQPVDSRISINGLASLPDGIIYYPQYQAPSIKVSANSDFTTDGVLYTRVNTISYANTLIYESYLQPGEFVSADNVDYMYMVSNSSNTLVQVGVYNELKENVNNALHLNGIASSNYVRVDVDDSISSSITLSNTSFLFLSNLAVRANSNSYTTIGYLNYNDNVVLASTSSQIFANNTGFIDTRGAQYQFNEVESASGDLYLDLVKSTFFTLELIGNTNIIFTNSQIGSSVSILVNNYGEYYISWPATVRWSNGRPPTRISSGSSAIYTILTMPSSIQYGIVKFGTYDY